MSMTERLALPLIASGQAQKEMTHNEALAALDIAVQPVVEAMGADTPPVAPEHGQCWIVGDTPTGAWAGQAGSLSGWTASGWRFLSPRAGWSAWVESSGLVARFNGTGWIEGVTRASRIEIGGVQIVAAQRPPVPVPSGGAIIDTEARTAISSIINAMTSHGLIAS